VVLYQLSYTRTATDQTPLQGKPRLETGPPETGGERSQIDEHSTAPGGPDHDRIRKSTKTLRFFGFRPARNRRFLDGLPA